MIQSNEIIRAYSKFCIPCIRGDEFKELEAYCRKRNVVVEIFRTTYQPALHQEAAKIWGSENYTMFLTLRDGTIYDFDEAIRMIRNGEELIVDKTVGKYPTIKKKPLRKGKKK